MTETRPGNRNDERRTLRLLQGVFTRPFPVVGMIHLLPLPGSPGWTGAMEAVLERAGADARALTDGGVDGVMVENYHDVPFLPGSLAPETVAALALAVRTVREATALPVGVNALRNDARAALGVAAATGARFIRVNVHAGVMWTDQGEIQGRAWETLRARRSLEAPVAILADVHVKHAVPPPGASLEEAARDAWHRGLADALVLSGSRTGAPTDTGRLEAARRAVPEAFLWVGSGAAPASAGALLRHADGLVAGTALQRGAAAGGPVERERVEALVEAVARVREGGGGQSTPDASSTVSSAR